MIESFGCKLVLLPPYSPDFNPIELSFSVLKKVIKRDYDLSEAKTPEELADMILKAATNAITPDITKNHFRHCMIYVRSVY